ncbi:histone H3-7-like [Euwallacea fornicatus]|uniref:histone H3-7-like n=1 Tax=Euwallacea fornicatus TaxID=995702 RepID=UPI00338EB85F
MKKNKEPKKKTTKETLIMVLDNKRYMKGSKRMYQALKHFQSTTALLVPKLPFSRLVHEIAQQFHMDLRMTASSLESLQEAAEHYIVDLFSDAQRCAHHAKRQTVRPVDVELVLELRGPDDPGK